jgi:hypothetical protein
VHPGDDADARRGRIRLLQQRADLLGRRHHGLRHDADGHIGRLVEAARDVPRVLLDAREHGLAIEVLAARDEPRLELLQDRPHGSPLPIRGGAIT